MRVLIVNTSEKTGGAAVAANRLKDALNNSGVKAKMLVRDKLTDDITVVGLSHPLRNQFYFLWERWCVFCTLISAENISLRLILPMQEWTLHSSQSSRKQT